jgi:hypothetical protein
MDPLWLYALVAPGDRFSATRLGDWLMLPGASNASDHEHDAAGQ